MERLGGQGVALRRHQNVPSHRVVEHACLDRGSVGVTGESSEGERTDQQEQRGLLLRRGYR